MSKDKVVGYIYETKDYGKFKHLVGNRSVKTSRIQKIINSIRAIGYRKNPIVVNSAMQIIDGQGRFEACKFLGLPIVYTIDKDAGIDVCQWLNIGCENWKVEDWVHSHADLGNKEYERLINLKSECETFTIPFIASICYGVQKGNVNEVLKNGSFKFRINYIEAFNALSYLAKFDKAMKQKIGGCTEFMLQAINFAFQVEGVDLERLLEKVEQNVGNLCGWPNDMRTALKFLQDWYNHGLKKIESRFYFETDYDKAMRDKYGWYAKKWGIETEE